LLVCPLKYAWATNPQQRNKNYQIDFPAGRTGDDFNRDGLTMQRDLNRNIVFFAAAAAKAAHKKKRARTGAPLPDMLRGGT
jgi:hypothetical protein